MNNVAREEERRKSLQAVKEKFLSSPENLSLLSNCMGDESWRVRKDAIDICVLFPAEEITAMLIDGLSSEDNAGLRNACQEALTKIGVPASRCLMSAFESSDNDVRKFIIDIMGDIGSPGFCDFLVAALQDKDENVVIAACENTGKLRCDNAIQPLLAKLDPKKQWLSFVIIESLAQIGKNFDPLPLMPLWDIAQLRKPILDLLHLFEKPYIFEILKKAFTDPSAYIHENAARNMYKLFEKDPEKLGELKDLLRDILVFSPNFKKFLNGKTEDEKTYALLAYISSSSEFFLTMLESGGDEALEFFGTLARFAPFDKSSLLTGLLDGFDERRQAYLVYLCGVFGIESSLDKLAALCSSSYGHTRQALAFSLGTIGGEKAVACLFELLSDQYPDVREQAVASLSKHLSCENFPDEIAKRVFESGTPEKIVSVLTLMNEVGYFREEYLYRALRSPFPAVRETAIDIIGKNRLTAFSNEILLYLTDEDEGVKLRAVFAMGEIGVPEDVKTLAGFLESDDMGFKKTALASIYKISPQSLSLYETSIFKNINPLFFLSLLELFTAGAPLNPALLINAAAAFDDREIYSELIAALQKMNFSGEAETLIQALELKKGKEFLPSHIKPSSCGRS